MGQRICDVSGCERPARARGWCGKHWTRWSKYGDPTFVKQPKDDPEGRFWSAVDKNGPVPPGRPDLGPCWVWTRHIDKRGYGRISVSGRRWLAHRWAYETYVSPVPTELDVDHLCRTPSCVNFAGHLEPVTHRENTLRGKTIAAANAAKTHCPRGHPYSGENLIRYEHRDRAERKCRTCERDRHAKIRARRRR